MNEVKQKVSIETVVADLKKVFEIDEPGNTSMVSESNRFMIDKQHMPRLDVLNKLQTYFADKIIDGGHVRVDSITFVFTKFDVIKGAPK